jgi:dolichyl-phosphate-mannose-protein mannosyltransferase
MQATQSQQRDPLIWCAALSLGFLALVWHRLGIPTKIYFDETHYIAAARKLLAMEVANQEHPMVGKEVIALSIRLLGDNAFGWRVPSALFGAFGLFALGRMVWWASQRRFATLAAMLLLITSFLWYVQSRIGMLDMIMAGFCMAGLWQIAVALNLPAEKARWRLVAAGVLFALALGTKWSVATVIMLPGAAIAVYRFRDHGRRVFLESDTRPLPGVTLWEAALWLGLLPLFLYWLTFLPTFFYANEPVNPLTPWTFHKTMMQLQSSVTKAHPYQSTWPEWVINWRAIWYLYEPADGAQRGILLIGNPFTMLAGLPALLWCLWAGLWQRRHDALGFAALYLAAMVLWTISSKPIQFYYHYLLPASFLMACLALALDDLWERRGHWRWAALAPLAMAIGMFAWFYPIISAAPLAGGKQAFMHWMWLDSWR